MNVSQGIRETLARRASERAIEFRGRWYSWGELEGYASRALQLLDDAGIPADAIVGLVAHTRPPQAGVILGFISANRSISMLYGFQSAAAKASDIRARRLRALIAAREDWTAETIAAAREAGTVGVMLDEDAVTLVPALERAGPGPFRPNPGEPALELLSSGTTGPPKLVPLPFKTLSRSVLSVTAGQQAAKPGPPVVQFSPFGNIAVCGLIARAYSGEPVALLEKFSLSGWVDATRRHRPTSASGPPPVIRSILAARVPREDLASIRQFIGGSAALEPATQEEFERIYGIPVLWGYGATEFGGSVSTWTPALRKEFGDRKRGSIGRPLAGTEVRIVDEAGTELQRGATGFLEARVDVIGPNWLRTTDLASMDEDGFLFLHGRGDGAIVRGGFKIIPERVVEVLRHHPGVMDAAVIGMPDPRLGQVPVAAVEPRPGAQLDAASLEAQVRAELPAHHVPARFLILAELPRTGSLKVSLADVRRLFENHRGKNDER